MNIEVLIGYIQSDIPQRRGLFKKEMRKLSTEKQDEIYEELERRNIDVPKPKINRTRTYDPLPFTKEDWNEMANLAWKVRKNDPSLTITEIIKKIQLSFPEEKRRKIVKIPQYAPLMKRLSELDQKLEKDSKDISVLNEELSSLETKILTREDVCNTLTDEELLANKEKFVQVLSIGDVFDNFSSEVILEAMPTRTIISSAIDRVLSTQENTGIIFRRFGDSIQELVEAIKSTPVAKPVVPSQTVATIKKTKVLICGLLPNQINQVEEAISDKKVAINFVDKNRTAGIDASTYNTVVLMANFISHSLQAMIKANISNKATLIIHHGGVSKLIERLKEVL